MTPQRPRPLRPERVRTPERPFGWVPFRLLSADRQGLSYWGEPRLAQRLGLSEPLPDASLPVTIRQGIDSAQYSPDPTKLHPNTSDLRY
jgi:hypothetical protein